SGVGQVSPDQPDYLCSDVVTLTAVPDAGSTFLGWQGDLSGTQNPIELVMSGDRTVTAVFAGDLDPPVISNVTVTPFSSGALITWDTDEPATSRVEFGLSAAYGAVVEDLTLVTLHSVVLEGLASSTTYHFQVLSADALGNLAMSADDTFETGPDSGLVSDDFNHCAGLIAPWSYIDPYADGSGYGVAGVGTDDAWMHLSVPGGANHDPYGAGLLPPRVSQPVFDVDFEFEVKFASDLTSTIQQQGVLIEQDADDWIRFDVYRSGSQNRAFVGSTVAGSTSTEAHATLSLMAPMHLRVTRVADDWTCWWSSDGSTWNSLVTFERVMAATQVSLYGGNSGGGGAPAHTAQVDWFQDTSKPIVTEDGSVAGSGPFTLTTNATGSGSVLAAPDQPDYLCTDVVDLTATPAGGWEFDHWEGDLTGSANPVAITLSANRSVTAVFTQDVTPPVISNLQVQVDQTSATFTWDTDEPATSIVNFGLTAGYGSTVMDPALGTSHMIVLDGLTPGTLYHYEVCSTDGAGLMACLPAATLVTQDGLGFVSDDFNTCAGLAGHWTFHDPGADGSLDVVGVGTDDAWMRLHVPAGSEHQAHDFLTAPYVSQTVNDVDFELETRLETVPSQQYEIQGLLVIEGPGSWLRFDVYHNGSELRMYAGRTIVNDTTKLVDVGLGAIGAPLWMRIRRVGDQWDQEYSVDGTNWFVVMSGVSHALDVNEVGLYVGNAVGVSSPAYVGAFDYVEDTAAPITDEDGFFGGSGPFTLTRTADPAFGGTLGASPDQVDYSCTDVVQVTATPAVGWQFSHWSGDLSGSSNPQVLSMSADRDVTAHFVQDIDPPVISNLAVSPGPTFATITWTTDEPADSSVDYGPDDGYGSTVLDTALVTDHVLLVGGLTPDTTYHFQVCSADLSGNTACTSDQTFTTNPDAGVVSDDFNAPNLNLGLWQFSDELGAAQAPRIVGPCTSDALLELRVPSGTEYLGWIVNDNVHVTQPVGNSDFELETKLETDFTGQYQSAGLIVIEDEDTWLRFDFQHTGSDLRILRASFDAGSATNYKATTVNAGDWVGAPLWMRVTRVGDQWSQAYSFDGNTWFGNGSAFGFVCAPTRVGLMAGNELPETNALGARFDYFFNSAAPLDPEDFQCPPSDTTEPLLVASAAPASDSAITVDWSTDELSTGSVVWGTAPGVYDQGSLNGNPLVFEESLLIPGLLSETTYHFQVTAADGSGNSSLSPDFSATTPPFGFDGLPDVEVWYGTLNGLGEPVLRFGHLGDAQTWINVPGRVTDELGGVVSLTYTLDNGTQVFGPNALDVEGVNGLDNFRLVDAGDFNVELAQPDLADGLNELTLTATDTDGNVVNQTVWIDYDAGNVWPLPFSVDWSTVTDLQDAAQFVDGWFRIDSSSGTPMLRNIRDGAPVHGYDRLFAVGDETWTDYEFVVDFEVHSLNPDGFTPGSNSHAFGVIMRWPGHSGGTEQPQEEFFPLGGLMAYRWYTVINEHWNLYSTDFVPNIHESPFYLAVDEGVHYLLRGQVEDQPGGEIRYRARMWEVGSSEPTDWPLEMNVPAGGLSSGSLLFIVHDVDASIGNLTITPL
ncbi:MAG: DUF1349 domain-containing protein, partial [Planctomycetota bacterium]|nr:DUF1349 domain-containing protein [Planctomycetota bacterium]